MISQSLLLAKSNLIQSISLVEIKQKNHTTSYSFKNKTGSIKNGNSFSKVNSRDMLKDKYDFFFQKVVLLKGEGK